MKKIITALLLIFFAAAPASAVKLAWDAPAEGTPAGYRIYISDTDDGGFVPLGDPVTGLELPLEPFVQSWRGKTKYVYVTAFNAWGESKPSNILALEVKTPGSVKIKLVLKPRIIFTE